MTYPVRTNTVGSLFEGPTIQFTRRAVGANLLLHNVYVNVWIRSADTVPFAVLAVPICFVVWTINRAAVTSM